VKLSARCIKNAKQLAQLIKFALGSPYDDEVTNGKATTTVEPPLRGVTNEVIEMTNENTQAAPSPAIEAKPKRTIEVAQKELEEVRVAHMRLLREIRELVDDAENGKPK
jgi:hypothetical protein